MISLRYAEISKFEYPTLPERAAVLPALPPDDPAVTARLAELAARYPRYRNETTDEHRFTRIIKEL
jgi:hypothetical protein